MNGLVSVVMPVYNCAAYVAEAVESVVSQTYANWDLIIVDDGSTDDSPAILQGFTDPRITIIRQENRGEGGARNTGLDVARGAYIGFLDADDFYLPNALTDFVQFFEAHPDADVVFSDGYFCDEQKRPLMRLSEQRPGHYTGNILEPLVLSPSIIAQPVCMMVRHAAVEARRVRFDENLRYGVDWDFWTQLARFERFECLSQPTGMYRVHQTNMTRVATVRKRKDDLVVGRLKIMRSDWFDDLSAQTRAGFFYYLVIDLLAGQPDRQNEVLQSTQFRSQSTKERCRLLRLVASDYLRRRSEEAFARRCLEQAHEAWPTDRKTALLLRLMDVGGPVCSAALSIWHTVGQAKAKVLAIGRATPRPVPAALLPHRD